MTEPTSVLKNLLGVPSVSDFLANHWMKSHCEFHGPLDRLPQIKQCPQLNNLEALLKSPHQRLRAFYRNEDGSHGEDFVTPEQALELFGRKLVDTIVIDGVHWGIPVLGEMALSLWDELQTPQSLIQCTAYLSPEGHGTQFHFDQQEVFFLQIKGKKKWSIAQNQQITFPLNPFFGMEYVSKDLLALSGGNPITPPSESLQLDMEAGSVLFLPRGYWHSSLAIEDSVSVTFTLCSRTWLEVIWEKLREEIILNEDWRKLAAGFGKGPLLKEHHQVVSQLMNELKSTVDSISLEDLAEHASTSDQSRKEQELATLRAMASSNQS
jgi:50S ribosomal protein L16 3-hydroxylase